MFNWLLSPFSIVLISRLFKFPVLSTWPHLFTEQVRFFYLMGKLFHVEIHLICSFFHTHLRREGSFYFSKNIPSLVEMNLIFFITHLPLSSSITMGKAINLPGPWLFSFAKLMTWMRCIAKPTPVLNQGFVNLMYNLMLFYPSRTFPFIQPLYILNINKAYTCSLY